MGMKYYDVSPTANYKKFYRENEIIEYLNEILLYIDNQFNVIRIPERFLTPESLLKVIRNFRMFLIKRKNTLFKDIHKQFKKECRDRLYSPAYEAESINDSLIEAMKFTLDLALSELSGKSSAIIPEKILTKDQKEEKDKYGYHCDDKLEFTNTRSRKNK
jgi:hypothetical protein